MTFLKKKSQKICKVYKKPLTLQPLSWIQSFYLKEANTYWDWNVRTVKWGRFLFYIPFPSFYVAFSRLFTVIKCSFYFAFLYINSSADYMPFFLCLNMEKLQVNFAEILSWKTKAEIIISSCLFRGWFQRGKSVVPELGSLDFLLVFCRAKWM